LVGAFALGTCWLFALCPASADTNSTERAAAEALFQQATVLMNEKHYAKACEKFEGSQQLDPALGTMLRLADCYDRISKTASAWSMFKEAASVARTRNEPDRLKIASDRGGELEKRLSRLQLKIDPKNEGSLAVRLNGAVIPRTMWDAPIPVDPGRQQVEASAPERVTWTGAAEVALGPVLEVFEVPVLAPKAPLDASTSPSSPAPIAAVKGGTQRMIGYAAGALSIVGLAGSGFLVYRAYQLNSQSLDLCRADDPDVCTPDGLQRRDSAKMFARGATVVLAASGALLAGSIVLVLSAPRNDAHPTVGLRSQTAHEGVGLRSQTAHETAGPSLRVSAQVTQFGGGLDLQGAW
jgi:hypothetical protein